MLDKSQYRLLSADHLDEFEGYDRVVAQAHLANCGYIIVSTEYGDPIDNEYDLEEIYNNINYLGESIKRKNTIKLTESELKNIISESVKNILKEISFINVSRKPTYFSRGMN